MLFLASKSMRMYRIVIVDDQLPLIKSTQEKLALFDDLTIKFTAEDGFDLEEKLMQNHHVDLILMDVEMPRKNGIEATEMVKSKYPQIKIIMLTVFDNDENIFKAIKSGADGYLLKDTKPQTLHDGIVDTMNGGASMTPSIAMKTLKLFRNSGSFTAETEQLNLTARETEVLEQLSKGLTYHHIAENLFVSAGTVRKHIENIYAKLNVHNKLEAIQKAKKNNLI